MSHLIEENNFGHLLLDLFFLKAVGKYFKLNIIPPLVSKKQRKLKIVNVI